MNEQKIVQTSIKTETDVVSVRRKAREIAAGLGLDHQDQIRVATAVSEIARNAYEYAHGGTVYFRLEEDQFIHFVIEIQDQGTGIEKIKEINLGTYISPQGMGLGISGAKRLMDQVIIETSKSGTQVILKKIIPYKKNLLTTKELQALTDRIISLNIDPLEDLHRQNQEIILAMEELKVKKDELQRINQELEDTNRGVVALYAELDEKAEFLRQANESKTSFLSDMTHEFRSPLNSIISLSQILMRGAKDDKDSEREKQVHFIIKAAKGLSDLVNDLLDIAKIEAGKLNVRTSQFALSEIVSSIRGLMKPIGANEKVELTISEAPEINLQTDENKLLQILRNLISNALKYTREGEVRVSFEDLGDDIEFRVKDTGIGIAKENLELIFEEFFQVEGKHQDKVKGTGLGLPLSRKLARLLGGTLWAESDGRGSLFILRLPKIYQGPKVGDYQVQNFKQLPPTEGSRRKILIVDDEESMRISIRNALKDLGLEIRDAEDGDTGLENMLYFQPDLVILDLNMPKMNGMEVIQKALEKPSTRSIPIVLHTSKHLEDEEREYFNQVTQGILVKDSESFAKIRDLVIHLFGLNEKK